MRRKGKPTFVIPSADFYLNFGYAVVTAVGLPIYPSMLAIADIEFTGYPLIHLVWKAFSWERGCIRHRSA
jgi:hypothetical protein